MVGLATPWKMNKVELTMPLKIFSTLDVLEGREGAAEKNTNKCSKPKTPALTGTKFAWLKGMEHLSDEALKKLNELIKSELNRFFWVFYGERFRRPQKNKMLIR